MHDDVKAFYKPLMEDAEGTIKRCQPLLPFWALELFDAEMLCNAAECVHLCIQGCVVCLFMSVHLHDHAANRKDGTLELW
jgi:hypothetical protein